MAFENLRYTPLFFSLASAYTFQWYSTDVFIDIFIIFWKEHDGRSVSVWKENEKV